MQNWHGGKQSQKEPFEVKLLNINENSGILLWKCTVFKKISPWNEHEQVEAITGVTNMEK